MSAGEQGAADSALCTNPLATSTCALVARWPIYGTGAPTNIDTRHISFAVPQPGKVGLVSPIVFHSQVMENSVSAVISIGVS